MTISFSNEYLYWYAICCYKLEGHVGDSLLEMKTPGYGIIIQSKLALSLITLDREDPDQHDNQQKAARWCHVTIQRFHSRNEVSMEIKHMACARNFKGFLCI